MRMESTSQKFFASHIRKIKAELKEVKCKGKGAIRLSDLNLLKELSGHRTVSPEESKRNEQIKRGQDNFWEYCLLRDPNFFKPDRLYQKRICDTMQLLYERKLMKPGDTEPRDILVLNLPPGAGKSYIASMFATWAFGQDVKNAVITVSYNETLATRFSKTVRDAIEDKEIPGDMNYYVPSSFFPDLKIKQGDGAMNIWSLEGSYMSYLATGFEGSITGMRGNIGIIDDPIKNASEAVNERVKEHHWDFYKNTFTSRMLDGAIQIIIQTRWASDDLAGKVLSEHPNRCYELKIQALDAEGNSWCESLYSTKNLLIKKQTLDPDIWDANYMQEPIDKKGGLYAAGFQTYSIVDYDRFERIINYTDTADTGADYLASISGGIIDRYIYILDVYYTDEAMEVTEPETARRLDLHRVRDALVESNNGGRGFARNVKRFLQRFGNRRCNVTWFTQSKNKKTRILVNASNVTEQVIMPEDWEKRWPEFAKAIKKYQRKGKNDHDDGPDALTGLVEMANGDVKGKRKVRTGSKKNLGI